MKYYSALKRKEILTYATTWVNLEDFVCVRAVTSLVSDSL